MATRTISNAGGSWNLAATWVEGSAPTAADDVVATATSGNITSTSAGSLARSVDFTNYVGTWTINAAATITIGDASGGALKLVAGMTLTDSTGVIAFASTSTNAGAGWGITIAGKTFASTFSFTGSGKWVFQDNLTTTGQVNISTAVGATVDFNGKTHTISAFVRNNANAVTLAFGAGAAFNLSRTVGTAWTFFSSTGLTTTGTFSMTVTSASAGARTISLSNASVAALTYTVAASTGTLSLVGFPTITTINIGAGRGLALSTPPSVFTITNWNVNGAAGSQTTLASTAAGTAASLIATTTAPRVSQYLTVTDIAATGAPHYVDPGGIDGGGTTGWFFGWGAGASGGSTAGAALSALSLLAGASAGASTGTASMGVTLALAGASDGGATVSAPTLQSAQGAAAASAGQATVSAALSVSSPVAHSVAGLTAGRATVGYADLTQHFIFPVQGRSAAVAGASGTIGVNWALEGRTLGHATAGATVVPDPTFSFLPPVRLDSPGVLATTRGVQRQLFRYYGGNPRGLSVVGPYPAYATVENPYADALVGTEGIDWFLGGHAYVVTKAVALALTASGYTVT